MNFVLRTHKSTGGPFRDEMLGPWKVITHRGDAEAFANEHRLMFEEPPKEISDEYFCFIRCERGVIPVFVGDDAYIMSESGKTFEKIYTHKHVMSYEEGAIDLPAQDGRKRNYEQELIVEMQRMCEESLDPKRFEKWEDVKAALQRNRQALKTSG